MRYPIRFFLSFFCFVSLSGALLSAENREIIELTLDNALDYARVHSPNLELVRQNFLNARWNYEAFMKDYFPEISLSGNIPGLNRSIRSVQQPDGTLLYRAQSQTYGTAALEVRQKVRWTGGTLSMSSGLERFDNLNTSNYYWRASPFVASYRQPLFTPNAMKWEHQLETIQYELARQAFEEDVNALNVQIVNAFFNTYIDQINLEIARINYTVNDTVYNLSKRRYSVGKIAENDLLQSELELMKAETNLESAQFELEKSMNELKMLLGMPEEMEFSITAPMKIPDVEIDRDEFLSKAQARSSEILQDSLLVLSADYTLKDLKARRRIRADLTMSFGYNQTGENIQDLYENPFDQEQFTMGLDIPLFNWGKNRAEIKAGESALKSAQIRENLTRKQVREDYSNVLKQFDQLKRQVHIAAQSDTVAQRRFEVTKNRYLIGKVDITHLFMAQQEQDLARRTYIQTLKNFWISYYQILGILNGEMANSPEL
jgi:outer membrane protein TolC